MAARLTAYLVVAIVGATLIAGLIVGAQREDSDGPVDLIVHNATVYTADRRATTAEAVAVRGNQILRVGTNREITRLRRAQTIVVDAQGGAVLPGFNDARAQLAREAPALKSIDLTGASSSRDILSRVAAWSAENPDQEWIVGHGWSSEHFRGGLPTRHALDLAVPDRPVLLFGAEEDTAWASSAALRLAGITRQTPDPAGGTIVREPRTGEPSGVLRGAAGRVVADRIPASSRQERAGVLRAAIAEANALGITSVQNTADSVEAFELYDDLRRSGGLTVRIYSAIPLHGPVEESDLQRLRETRDQYPDDPLFKVGALSVRLDGQVSARSAAMLEPYLGSGESSRGSGSTLFAPDDLNRTVRLADAAGWQIVTHATGDRAVRMALDAYAHAIRSNRVPARGRRHRIESIAIVDLADIPRFGSLGVVASVQPSRANPTLQRTELFARHLGPARAGRTFPFRTLADETRLVFGSAWPLHGWNPLIGLHVAATRTTLQGTPAGGWHPDERLPLKPAIDAYTSAAAWASFDEQRKGSISPGMLADIVVLSEDIFETPPGSLASASVEYTIFDGRIVYSRAPRSETVPSPAALTQ